MKILLIQADLGRKELPIFPLGLAYLASGLREHEVQGFDLNTEDHPFEEMKARIREFRPEIIGISLRNIDTTVFSDPFYYFKTLESTVDIIRETAPKSCLIIGGSGFSIFGARIMEGLPKIDFGVHLEGEESFPELLNNLGTPGSVKGIYYWENGKLQFSGKREPLNFYQSGPPRYDLFDLKRYNNPEGIGVQSKRGCFLQCIYCVYPFLTGKVSRLRPPAAAVDDIEELRGRWGVTQFMFADSVFAPPKEHAVAICEEIVKRKIKVKWTAYFNERETDLDFLKLAEEAGCNHFQYSSDGFNDQSLRLLKKPFTRRDVMNTYRLSKKFKEAHFSFFFFANPPGQTFASFLGLMWLMARTNYLLPRKSHIKVRVNIPRLMPNTELYHLALDQGTIALKTDLLPQAEEFLPGLFYRNPQVRSVELIFTLMHKIKNLLRKSLN